MTLLPILLACVVVAGSLLAIALSTVQMQGKVDWHKKWPPIDDDEFVRRCTPGVNREVALRVRRIISEQLGIEYARIYPEQHFVEDLDCD